MALNGIFASPIFVYFMSNHKTQDIEIAVSLTNSSFILSYFLYIFFNILGFFICIYHKNDLMLLKSQYVSVFLLLLIIPLFKMGEYNDLMLKSSILPLFILHYHFAEEFYQSIQKKVYNSLQIGVYLICLSGLFSFFYVQFKIYNFIHLGKYIDNQEIPFNAYNSIDKMLKEKYSAKDALQYRGNMNSIYAKYLAKNTLEKALN